MDQNEEKEQEFHLEEAGNEGEQEQKVQKENKEEMKVGRKERDNIKKAESNTKLRDTNKGKKSLSQCVVIIIQARGVLVRSQMKNAC